MLFVNEVNVKHWSPPSPIPRRHQGSLGEYKHVLCVLYTRKKNQNKTKSRVGGVIGEAASEHLNFGPICIETCFQTFSTCRSLDLFWYLHGTKRPPSLLPQAPLFLYRQASRERGTGRPWSLCLGMGRALDTIPASMQ